MVRFAVQVAVLSSPRPAPAEPPAGGAPSPGSSLSTSVVNESRSRGLRVTQVSVSPGGEAEAAAPGLTPVLVPPALLDGLGLAEDRPYWLRFGLCRVQAAFQANAGLPRNQVRVPAALAEAIGLEGTLRLSIFRSDPREVALGPLIGVLVSGIKLQALLDGRPDTVYCRYDRYAREAGAALFFFTAGDLDPDQARVRGHVLRRTPNGGWDWRPRRFPVPRVVYDRCFGYPGRAEALRIRRLSRELGFTVVNRPVKITKLQAFAALGGYPDLAVHLPFTVPLTRESLEAALDRFADLYLKPNALHKGQGVFRLTRQPNGWLLQSREEQGNAAQLLSGRVAAAGALAALLEPGSDYVLQEGLSLATYLGNRFDFRSLVQKDGQGQWAVTGVVARIAPVGSVISSPRSGGQVSPADRVLRHAFPDRWQAVLADLEQVSLDLSARLDQHLGPCAELGLDVAVVADGTVKLIEVNGKPLKVSLQRLRDPWVNEQMFGYPVHYAAYLDTVTPPAPAPGDDPGIPALADGQENLAQVGVGE